MTDLAREYGDGLFALAVEEKLDTEWLQELNVLKQCFRDTPDFVRLLGNLSLTKEERLSVLDSAFRGKVHPYVLNFLKILCERGVMHEFCGCAERFHVLYNQAHNIVEAVVTTGAPLSASQRDRLCRKLADMTGRQVSVTERVDPAVIGGIVLEMDGKRYDNSVAHRLESIRRVISGKE